MRVISSRPSAAGIAALVATTMVAAASPPAGLGGDEAGRLVLASVNGETITLADLRESFGARHDGHGGLLVGEEIITKVVQKAIDEKLIVQEGRRMGIPGEPGFRQAVEVYRDTQLLGALEARYLGEPAQATPAEVEAAYDLLPRQVRVAVIETRERARAEEARLRVRLGEGFDAVARRMSAHQSRARGGDLGWVTWGILDPATEAVALRTPGGQVSEPFASGEAFRVVSVMEERRGEPPPFAQVADRIAAIIRGRKQAELRASLISSIRKQHPPLEEAAAIAKLVAAPETGTAAPAPDPPDAAVLMRTAAGLAVTAGHVRHRAQRSGLSLRAAWKDAADDALLIDEARRRMKGDPRVVRQVELFVEGRLREEVERTAILKGISIDDAQVRAFYEKDPAAFGAPASYHMRHIVLATRPEAEEVKRRLDAGADFAALAKERSSDSRTAASGGDLGWVDGPADGAPAGGVFAMAAGQTSGVVKTSLGHAIVQIVAIRPGAIPSFEAVRHEAAQRLMIQMQHDLREAFVSRLRKVARITVARAALARAVTLQGKLAERSLKPDRDSSRKGTR